MTDQERALNLLNTLPGLDGYAPGEGDVERTVAAFAVVRQDERARLAAMLRAVPFDALDPDQARHFEDAAELILASEQQDGGQS